MAVTYTNNFNNIMDKLMETIKAEMPVPVQKTTSTQPLLKANDAIEVDTTHLSIDQQVNCIVNIVINNKTGA